MQKWLNATRQCLREKARSSRQRVCLFQSLLRLPVDLCVTQKREGVKNCTCRVDTNAQSHSVTQAGTIHATRTTRRHKQAHIEEWGVHLVAAWILMKACSCGIGGTAYFTTDWSRWVGSRTLLSLLWHGCLCAYEYAYEYEYVWLYKLYDDLQKPMTQMCACVCGEETKKSANNFVLHRERVVSAKSWRACSKRAKSKS